MAARAIPCKDSWPLNLRVIINQTGACPLTWNTLELDQLLDPFVFVIRGSFGTLEVLCGICAFMVQDTCGSRLRLSVTCVTVVLQRFDGQVAGTDEQCYERYDIDDMAVLDLSDQGHQKQKAHCDTRNDNRSDELAGRVLQ